MVEWLSVTVLLGSFAVNSVTKIESWNITAFSMEPVLPKNCLNTVVIACVLPSE
jgi:hypothetical protein